MQKPSIECEFYTRVTWLLHNRLDDLESCKNNDNQGKKIMKQYEA